MLKNEKKNYDSFETFIVTLKMHLFNQLIFCVLLNILSWFYRINTYVIRHALPISSAFINI